MTEAAFNWSTWANNVLNCAFERMIHSFVWKY